MKSRKKNVATLPIRNEPKPKRNLPRSITQIFQKGHNSKLVITKKLDFSQKLNDKNVYFMDITALVYYSGPLYGGFLNDEQFLIERIVPGDNNIFITDEATLEELQAMENDKTQKLIYSGYTEFINRNLYVIPAEESKSALTGENMLREIAGSTEDIVEEEFFAHIMGSLRYLYNNNIDPILISLDETTVENATKRTYATYEPK